MPRITNFCICMYVFGCKLSLVRICDSDFGITPVDDITMGITCAAFCSHIAHISFASSWYFFVSRVLFWRVYVYLGQLCLSKKCSLFFIHKSYVRSIKSIILSVSMLRFPYTLKFSISSTFVGVYL